MTTAIRIEWNGHEGQIKVTKHFGLMYDIAKLDMIVDVQEELKELYNKVLAEMQQSQG